MILVLLLTVLLYGPLAAAALLGGPAAGATATATRPYDVVAGLASTLEQADEGSEQLAVVADAVASAFGVGYVRVEVDRTERRAADGDARRPRPPRCARCRSPTATQEVGRVVLPARGLRSRLSRRDEQLLGDLVRQAATAARTSQLADELQDSRERLVVAREEERRRIRRDLHDGLGPSLSGVVYQLESARLLVDKDPRRGQGDHRRAERTTCRTWSPTCAGSCTTCARPRSTTVGLVGALAPAGRAAHRRRARGLGRRRRPRDPARRGRGRGVPHRRRGAHQRHPARPRPARAPCACCVTSVTCSSRSPTTASASRPEAQAGVGLVSLRERAAELGGRSEVTCPATGGTLVRAWLPLTHHSDRNPS